MEVHGETRAVSAVHCFGNPSSCLCKITALKIKYNPFAKAFLDAKER